MRGLLATAAYTAAWAIVPRVPARLAAWLFGWGAELATRRDGAGVRQLRANLARVMPKAGPDELTELVGLSMRSYARYWCETFRLPAMDPEAVHVGVEDNASGQEYLHAAMREGNGVVIALPHSGSYDVAGVWLLGHTGTLTVVAQRLRPEAVYQRFTKFRRSLGFEILPTSGGDRPPAEVLADRLRANRVVCLFADRDLTERGVPVTFFGETTKMPAGPAYLAATTGAALLPVGCWFTERGWGLRVHPPIKVAGVEGIGSATQALADVFAADIAAHPADWHMLQRLWLADE
ncbi:phosphatidylinositol mannoside acyltransferase [Kutzneria viridogrisea]|uniref:Phosphatidylinositol mannoside acyltransferase n=2 Tax=Kutzneria TaxID=43356 RepID=W5W3M9_9PSEU|nr:phosphatidylinositol mannoside acyltransferase [Kutzneria albida]AHH95818.1 Phosphatidylinositol mannoside acyltransferase [Kutzneria albida DSM 43870]MBA8926662.1 KDO2-lipid IV(A) lauroyltransferase [Kutzneria viridogrisea]